MYELYRELIVKTTREKAWDFIKDPANLNKITPNDLSFEISPPNMKSDLETITLYRDYSFDENNIMGNSDREEQIKKEMVATSASLIYNRLNALINKSN